MGAVAHDAMLVGSMFAILTFTTNTDMNPTVSVAKFVGAAEKDAAALGGQVAGQVAGGLLGGLLFLIAKAFEKKAVIPNFVEVGDLDTGCLTLLLVGFVVVSLILGSDGKDANFQALFTGVAYYIAASLGTHLNPALTFGGSLINTFHGNSDGQWTDHWVHWIMPLAAGALAALFNKFRNRDGASGTPSAGDNA